jgi:hypothetical protein
MKTFGLPSGIGDVSWAYSKLVNAGRFVYQVADGWPHRTVPFMELLPGVETACYGQFNFGDIVAFEGMHGYHPNGSWKDIEAKGFGVTLIEPNRHLEMGKRLEDWLPDLECNFHYEINVPQEDRLKARNRLATHPKPWTGISAASYRGSEAWKTWGYKEWSPFLKDWKSEVGGTIFLIGGFWDDLTDTLADDGYVSLVGKSNIGTVVSILDLLDYYIGFSSGLGVVRTVLKRNAFMLWPDFQAELSTSWAPLDMIESGTYVAQLWRDPTLVIKRARRWLKDVE